MAKKTKKAGSSAGLVRLTRQQVLEGVPGPDGVRIAFAAAEAAMVTSLLKAAADDLETGHLEALAQGRCGTWLLDALEGADLGEPLVRATAAGVLQAAAAELSLPLVAWDGDGQVIGALLGVPSGTVASGLSRLPASRQQVLMSMLTYAKIKAVAVSEDARRRGIGAALLKRCVQLYWQLDYTLLFSEFDTGRELGPYYTRQGFTVLRPGQAVDVGTLLTGAPLHLGAGPGLTFFYWWRGSGR
ncbi:GNAT family N-acetyltransferase [Streptomyces chartreusis]|uniref:GNAT family N-acetyltransferase n=1 Tax=Streptomyces chartreusis TaxID=1969 RepID=A0A7H8TL64_STRCX|nr:GNAT family N-acetyltransferase [Streptomyces chartreusis]QKZ23808.1 GNAT family N-acetyltransferase [Streptomyces chartreusis]